VLRRLSGPHWFQALGCVLGFDWHSSGVADDHLQRGKEAVRGSEQSLGAVGRGRQGPERLARLAAAAA
jgi:hypothetical protein